MSLNYLRRRSLHFGVILFCVLSGCTHFHETYYVGMYDPPQKTNGEVVSNPQETQLYRYEILGTSLGSKTQFASGLYDAKVIDRLFGEVRPTSTGATSKPSKPGKPADPPPSDDALPAEVKPADAQKDDHRQIFVKFGPEGTAISQSNSERMVIFMSSDPQALTDRISALVKAQQTQATIAKVIAKPHTDEQTSTIQAANDEVAAAKSASAAFLDKINAADEANTVKLCAKQLIQTLQPTP